MALNIVRLYVAIDTKRYRQVICFSVVDQARAETIALALSIATLTDDFYVENDVTTEVVKKYLNGAPVW